MPSNPETVARGIRQETETRIKRYDGSGRLLDTQTYLRTSVDLPRALHKRMRRRALEEDRILRDVVIDAIQQYVDRAGGATQTA